MINKEDGEITTDQVGYAVESAVTLLGNAFAQMSMLRRQRVLEEYNKELITFAQGRETEFLKAAPELFGPKFPRDATEHLDQLAALRKAKASKQQYWQLFGFSEAPLLPFQSKILCSKTETTALLPASQRRREAHQEGTEGSQMTINRQFKQFNCMSQFT